MKEIIKRILILALGWFFIILGIIGLFLPILQGILFLFIGLIILSRASKTVKNWLEKLQTRYPKFGYYLDKAKKRLGNGRKKLSGEIRRIRK